MVVKFFLPGLSVEDYLDIVSQRHAMAKKLGMSSVLTEEVAKAATEALGEDDDLCGSVEAEAKALKVAKQVDKAALKKGEGDGVEVHRRRIGLCSGGLQEQQQRRPSPSGTAIGEKEVRLERGSAPPSPRSAGVYHHAAHRESVACALPHRPEAELDGGLRA